MFFFIFIAGYKTGLVLTEQPDGSEGNPIIRRENETFSLDCVFTVPTDVPEPVTIQWVEGGSMVRNSDNLMITETQEDNVMRIITTELTFSPLESYYNDSSSWSPYGRVYNCQGFVGRRFEETITSDGIHLEVECKNKIYAQLFLNSNRSMYNVGTILIIVLLKWKSQTV